MSPQVDHDLLADYLGGALEGTPEQTRVAGLIATSPQWHRAAGDLTRALGSVSQDLQALRGTPEKMPPDIAMRFDALLAQPKVDPLAARVPARRVPSGRARAWRRWSAPVAIAAAALAFVAIKGPLSAELSTGTAAEAPQQDMEALNSGAPPAITSGKSYDRGALPTFNPEQGGPIAPNDQPDWRNTDALGATSVPELKRLADPNAFKQCLQSVTATLPGTVTYVEFAYFEYKPALVISIYTSTGPWHFVAGPDCGLNGPHELYRAPR